jgi:transcriptional regulator with XRE-family HTH domain
MDILLILGDNIKQIRKEKGLSQERLAHLANLDRTYLPSIEQGKRNVSIVVLHRISIALGVSISELLKNIENGV